jgi:hypothetical protein
MDRHPEFQWSVRAVSTGHQTFVTLSRGQIAKTALADAVLLPREGRALTSRIEDMLPVRPSAGHTGV